ncbi:MAG: hypothetical protein F6K47_13680 [Symploca sp. SIO2E6]|nr:hypothetical protein [Symploca sp. SIO2E6]
MTRVIVGLCLIVVLWLVSGEAQAGKLANRLAEFPHWESKPAVASAKGDLVYPDWMEGTWQVTSTLVEQFAPLAPAIVTPGFASNRSHLNQPISFFVRFHNQQPSLSVISSRFLPFAGKDIPKNTSGVVADREFNGLNISRAYLGDRTIVSVKVDPDNPNRQVTSLRNGSQLLSIVTGRASETPNSEQFIATEIAQQIFRGSSQPYFNQVETTTSYRLLTSSSVEYLNFGGNKAEGRRQKAEGKKEGCKVSGNYNCLSELDIASPSLAIEAEQITAVYLSPQDPKYFQAVEKPVALYRYRLELFSY